ncbi:MAG: hypothetical protein PVI35_01070 [Acidimicrobiia bacterium]|jgi:hypothetical protein
MSDDDLAAVSLEVRRLLVARFDSYVREQLAARGVTVSAEIGSAIERGAKWLDGRLGELFSAAAGEQRSAPLALFQAALAFPTDALEREGVPAPARDDAEAAALPGDTYRLAPASSQDLGDEVWQAHAAWGVAKAKALGARTRRPETADPEPAATVALFSADAPLRGEVGALVHAAGYPLEVWRNPGALDAGVAGGAPVVAIVDLDHPTADAALRDLAAAAVPVIAVGRGIDDLDTARARALGAREVLGRERLSDRLGALLPRLA